MEGGVLSGSVGVAGAVPGLMVGLVASLSMMIASWEKSDRVKDRYQDKNREYGEEFDFIIVGGGTGGSLLANRLSKNYKVLLLEAGGEPHPFHSIPLLSNYMAGYENGDWMHTTTPQRNALFASPQNSGRISGGKGLGGTSNLDHMMHLRGHPKDYDEWVRVTGDPGWSYASLLPYFTKHENYQGFWKDKQKGMHGGDGEMTLTQPTVHGDTSSSLGKRFIVAGNEMGVPHVDLNSVYEQGFDSMTSPTYRGHRQSAYDAFLRRGQGNRWNLLIHKYATVLRILTRGPEIEAYAIEYERHGQLRHAYAKKEIILSAGAINTAKLLLLSGFGDMHHLQGVGVPVRVHLPGVGKNLHDHLGVPLGPFYTRVGESTLMERDVGPTAFLSLSGGVGPLTSSGYDATAMLTSDLARTRGDPHWPDVQLTLKSLGLSSTAAEDATHIHRLRRRIMDNYYDTKGGVGRDAFSIIVSGTRPKSRGEVKLRDASPLSPPLINPAYLEEVEDVGVLVDGIRKAMRLVEGSLQFKQIGAQFTNRSIDGCGHFRHKSDEYWSCFVRVMALPMGDVVGTAGMGGVVDNELRVVGSTRLRVVDASVIPSIVSGGTSAATLAIAEKAAAMILGYWGPPDKVASMIKESSQIGSILRESAGRLRAMDTGAMFFQHMKSSPSFRQMAATVLSGGGSGSSATSSSRNPFHILRPLFESSLTSVTTGDQQPQQQGEEEAATPSSYNQPLPDWSQLRTQQPPPPQPQYQYIAPPTTTTQKSTSTRAPPPQIATLFSDHTDSQQSQQSLHNGAQGVVFNGQSQDEEEEEEEEEEGGVATPPIAPYVLLPSTTSHPLIPHNLGSAVDSYLFANNPAPFHTTPTPFSKKLQLLAFPKARKAAEDSAIASTSSSPHLRFPQSSLHHKQHQDNYATPTTTIGNNNARPIRAGLAATSPPPSTSFTQNLLLHKRPSSFESASFPSPEEERGTKFRFSIQDAVHKIQPQYATATPTQTGQKKHPEPEVEYYNHQHQNDLAASVNELLVHQSRPHPQSPIHNYGFPSQRPISTTSTSPPHNSQQSGPTTPSPFSKVLYKVMQERLPGRDKLRSLYSTGESGEASIISTTTTARRHEPPPQLVPHPKESTSFRIKILNQADFLNHQSPKL